MRRKYAVSEEGIQSLRELETQLLLSVLEIKYATARMMKTYEQVEEDLGVFRKDILICLREVLSINSRAEENINLLIKYGIEDQIERISQLLIMLKESTADTDSAPGGQYVKRYPR